MATTMTRTDAHRLLARSFEMGDAPTIMGADRWAIASVSHPGTSHVITRTTCDCEGFRQRGMCRHFVRVAWEVQGRPEIAAIPATRIGRDPMYCNYCRGEGRYVVTTGFRGRDERIEECPVCASHRAMVDKAAADEAGAWGAASMRASERRMAQGY